MKKYINDCIAIIAFLVISFIYFMPSVLDGRVLLEHDAAAGIGAGEEARVYYEENGERTRWTNGLFSGMPTYQISPSYDSTDNLKFIEKAYKLFLPQYVGYIFIMMIGFYILMRSLKLSPGISCIGGIVWAFSSYFFILIAAGHIWKFITLAYIPPTIAGIILVYNRKYILGALLATLFASLQILSNHIQMTYYFIFVILFIVIAYFIQFYKNKDLKEFFKSTGILAVSALIAVSINLSNLYHTYQYSKESTRGKSELVLEDDPSINNGVDKAYITQWSYGIDETLTLLIPNFKGGASKPLAESKDAMNKANPQFYSIYEQISQYFGSQPFTAGPVYVGAFVLFLFIAGCFIVKGPLKWALVAGTLFSILLSWGKNFMPITNFFIDYIPLYDKFRSVSSILVVAEFTIPLLAMLALSKLIETRDAYLNYKKPLFIALGVTGVITLLTALVPSILAGPFISDQEYVAINQLDQNVAVNLISNLEEMRTAMVRTDAWRSLVIIAMGCFALLLYYKDKINRISTIILIAGLCLADMWLVNTRYLNDDLFVPKSNINKVLRETAADKLILEDKDPNYRVLNLVSNTFNENNTSYWHKSIGGYNAAKPRRYQELIEACIQPEMGKIISIVNETSSLEGLTPATTPVLNMLNTKYYILGQTENSVAPNLYRNGNAWFISDLIKVDNANEELKQLKTINTKTTGIVNQNQFADVENHIDENGFIELTQYQPNELTYKVSTEKGGIALFSEMYYPGWTATINGEELPLFRANYVLRAVDLPKGEYEIKFSFHPKSLSITETIAYIGLAILLIGVVILTIRVIINRKKKE